ncbi:MAG: VWA domain-containing protein [Planctomycetaceae bacterium]|nr:VWA domain-containing protein [Planctomycetaceae bacterium]
MSWPGFVSLGGAWLFLLLVPLVIFYFLKLKRPRMDIPSLALWRSVLNDQRVNAPFQRFKRNLLLLLQALLLICLALAAMQPFWPSGADRAQYLPILIDTSASMGALDTAGGRSRLEAAKEEIRKLIDNLLPDQRLSLIAVSSTARRLTDFSDNKRVLRDALAQIEVSPVASRLEDALRMTQALARTVPVETVVLYTDGNVPADIDFELPFQLNYQKLPPAGQNIGITAINARRSGERWDVFVRIDGSKEAQTTAGVQLLKNGQPIDDEVLSLEPGQSQRIVFHVDGEGPSSLEVRLKPDGFDSLASDNTVYLDLPVGRPLTVYCPPDLTSFRHALRGLKDVTLYPQDDGKGGASSYDLAISDRPSDAALDAAVLVSVGVLPDDLAKLVKVDSEIAEVVDWQRSAPLLQHVLLTDVQIAERPVSAAGVRDRDYEEQGYEILAQGRTGPLVLKKDASGRPSYFFLFHTDRSTLPYRVGFPILVTNAVQLAQAQAGLAEARGQSTGLLAPRTLKSETVYRVTAPDGEAVVSKTNAEGLLSGVSAAQVGRYRIEEGGREVASVGVSLLTGAESSLASVDRLQFKEIAVGASETILKSDRPLWPFFAVLGFVLLLAEWWFFQRRPGGLPA